jgi:hypothetical protein
MLFEGTRSGGREDCLSTRKSREERKKGKEWNRRLQIWRAEFRSAEKSVEGTALRTRLGARPMALIIRPRDLSLTPLFVTEPAAPERLDKRAECWQTHGEMASFFPGADPWA